ncbi:MAG: punA, partial [Clostridia bacterium]|nr:punA [Clostridia bacterium]
GNLVDAVKETQEIAYADIPNFPISTVKGHEGKLVFGTINGTEVLLMQGRFHYYEGYTMREITYPIYVMKQLGIEKIIVTNACGGINRSFEPGTLMLIRDFINLFGDNPLIGINDERFGPRFPDMSETAAEIVMIERNGADAVGMSTVPETIVANYLGIDVLGIACITNMATGIQKVKHSHERVVETAQKASERLCRWVEGIINEIN